MFLGREQFHQSTFRLEGHEACHNVGFYLSEKDENQRNRSMRDGMWAVTVQKSGTSAIAGTMSENSEIQSAGL